jgi:hypothetical protein
VKAWGLFSSRVDLYHPHDLLELFTDEADARAVRDALIGLPVDRGLSPIWEDDDEFPDLYVRPLELR